MFIDSKTINLIFTSLSPKNSYWIMSENIPIAVSNPSLCGMLISVELVHKIIMRDLQMSICELKYLN